VPAPCGPAFPRVPSRWSLRREPVPPRDRDFTLCAGHRHFVVDGLHRAPRISSGAKLYPWREFPHPFPATVRSRFHRPLLQGFIARSFEVNSCPARIPEAIAWSSREFPHPAPPTGITIPAFPARHTNRIFLYLHFRAQRSPYKRGCCGNPLAAEKRPQFCSSPRPAPPAWHTGGKWIYLRQLQPASQMLCRMNRLPFHAQILARAWFPLCEPEFSSRVGF